MEKAIKAVWCFGWAIFFAWWPEARGTDFLPTILLAFIGFGVLASGSDVLPTDSVEAGAENDHKKSGKFIHTAGRIG